ncbi:MAG: mechanosensitive ion channel [Bacteroidales bacterium]|nr:mechanosensitive ion channel [Bacteroidales bacterium]MBD5284423.1 mechanosensitive ion channel [Bacteroides sp.]
MITLCSLIAVAEKASAVVPKVSLSPETEQNTYTVARWIMGIVNWLLSLVGLEHNTTLFLWIYAALVFVISIGIGYVVTWVILGSVKLIGKRLKTPLYQGVADSNFFRKASRIVPAIVFLILIQFTLVTHASLATWLSRLTWIYLTYVICRCTVILIGVIWHHIDVRENKRHLPLRGLVQLIKGLVWMIFAIITLAILFDKSPGSLLAGLGAFAAVLMLIFKDSILGVVAGVQLSENDSLHVGDWIAIGDANGTVTQVSLTSVTIENWDKTTSNVPPYNFVSNGFKNYRSMQESHTRRIQRSWLIDADSVVPCDDAMLADFAKIPLLTDWIQKKIEQKKAGKECNAANPEGLVNGTIDTNLGVFRAYLQLYLEASSEIDKNSDCFVSTLAQTSQGLPLQIYCFTTTSSWIPYEAIQSALFEHIAVMLFRFRLYVFENATGRDTILEGYMCNPDPKPRAYGLPYPFYDPQRVSAGDAVQGPEPALGQSPQTASKQSPAANNPGESPKN